VALNLVVAAALVLAGASIAAFALRSLVRRRREGRYGTLLAIDDRPGDARTLRSDRYGISGRPDELRRGPDGRWVPVEFKSRTSPRWGPPRSHRVQLAAYCLLVEETTGRAPPFGVLRYGDGREFRLAWDASARAEVLAARAAVGVPYDGRATPSVGRCSRCPWRASCDQRAV
jgi:CRISPR-associated exonuclease Cas4